MVMLAEYGKLSLREVLEPAIHWRMATRSKEETRIRSRAYRGLGFKQSPNSRAVMLATRRRGARAPEAGEIFRHPSLQRRSASW